MEVMPPISRSWTSEEPEVLSGNDDRLAAPTLRQVIVVEALALDAFLQQDDALHKAPRVVAGTRVCTRRRG
jgi:hypothetical protein